MCNSKIRHASVIVVQSMISSMALGQTADGNAGLNQATTMVNSYFSAGTNLMYAVGAILGLIGAVKVYQKWNHGDHDTGKVAAAWFGSCIFLVIVATVIKSFFGIS
jgi:high-affinity nickel permease